MAQAQLEFTEESKAYLRQQGFTNVHWSPVSNRIYCELDNKHTIIVKKSQTNIVTIIIKQGNSKVKLSAKLFESLCDLKQSVFLLKSFLEGQ